jgi:hypothetical protein
MHGAWKCISPHCANRSDFEEETVVEEITNIGKELGFDGLENEDVRELLNSHSEELTDDDLLLSDQQRTFEGADSDAEERDNLQVKEFSLEEFEDIFRAVEFVKQKIMDADPNLDRSMQIHRDVDKSTLLLPTYV